MDFSAKWQAFWKTLDVEYWQKLLIKGITNTIEIAVLGLVIGIFIGTLIAIVKVSPKYNPIVRVLDKICSLYVALFRGTPMVVQLLLAYYVFLPLCGAKNVNALVVGIIVFGLNSGAYVSEIMRGGINSIDVGQMEAARSCGMTSAQAMRFIILPQAIKNILPAIGNEFITMVKETSIIQYLGISDLMYNNGIVVTATYNPLPCYYISAILYLLLNIILGKGINIFEVRLKRNER